MADVSNEELEERREIEQGDAFGRTEEQCGGLVTRRLSAMDIAMLRRNKNAFVMGFTQEFVDKLNEDISQIATLIPDILQFLWLFKVSEADYIRGVQDNDFYLTESIKLGMGMDYDAMPNFIPDIQRIIGESRKVSVKPIPADDEGARAKLGQKKSDQPAPALTGSQTTPA